MNRDNVANSFRNAIQMMNKDNEALKLRETVILVDTYDSFAVQKASKLSICFSFTEFKIFQNKIEFHSM